MNNVFMSGDLTGLCLYMLTLKSCKFSKCLFPNTFIVIRYTNFVLVEFDILYNIDN